MRAPNQIESPALSPDGNKVAVSAAVKGTYDIWIHDAARGTKTRLTSNPGRDGGAAWSPDGAHIVFYTPRQGNQDLSILKTDKSTPSWPLVIEPHHQVAPSWSSDGKYILYYQSELAPQNRDLWYVSPADSTPYRMPQTPFDESNPHLSPDGHYVAYQSNDSGRWEVYVTPFPGGGERVQVSVNGGGNPRWTRQGTELVYVYGDSTLAVSVQTTPAFRADLPRMLFTGAQVRTPRSLFSERGLEEFQPIFDVTPDGERFVVVRSVGQMEETPTTITVVQNWIREFQNQQ